MRDQLKKTMDALLQSFHVEAERKHLENIQNTLEEYSYLNIEDPEEYNLLMSQTLHEQEEVYISLVLRNIDMEAKKKHRLEFLYSHYDFVVNHLEGLIVENEGHSCSGDKTTWLLREYRTYFICETYNEMPDLPERKYWHPKFAQTKEWLCWIDTFYDLYHGDISKYLAAKEAVVVKPL